MSTDLSLNLLLLSSAVSKSAISVTKLIYFSTIVFSSSISFNPFLEVLSPLKFFVSSLVFNFSYRFCFFLTVACGNSRPGIKPQPQTVLDLYPPDHQGTPWFLNIIGIFIFEVVIYMLNPASGLSVVSWLSFSVLISWLHVFCFFACLVISVHMVDMANYVCILFLVHSYIASDHHRLDPVRGFLRVSLF